MSTARWYLAPATDLTDRWSAGYDGNSFATRDEAEAAIAGLRGCGEDFAATEWVAVQERDELSDAVDRLDRARQKRVIGRTAP